MIWNIGSYKMVSLEKTTDMSGMLPLGHVYSWTFTSNLTEWAAIERARKALHRDHPDENPIHWTTV